MPQHWRAPNRIGSRRGQELRKLRLQAHPLCAECLKAGIVKATDEIDHIVPLSMGGEDVEDNVQGLCFEHHAAKTALEDSSHQAAANHPEWLEPSAIPVTIVCGPPASGKTTYVREHAALGDTVIDLDAILASIEPNYRPWSQINIDGQLLNRAIRVRNSLLGGLKRKTSGSAWLIVAAPAQAEREWWANKLGGTALLLHPGVEELKRRALARGTPLSIEGITKWERRAKQPWKPAQARRVTGVDGWPTS